MRLFAICLMLLTLALPATGETIEFRGKEYWINGVNVPWNQFGTDVGAHPSWGSLHDLSWFETFFVQCEESGINCVRFWIHCDGRASPEFDVDGSVTGLDPSFLDELEDILESAENHNVMVMPCLWSFDMTADNTAFAGPYAGLHADLIQDEDKTQSYIDNALIPMLNRFTNAPNLFAWEISNEPEWSVENGHVTQFEIQRFCAMIAAAIHENSDQMVTLGSAALKWNSDVSPAEANWWSDAALQAQYASTNAYLDFYQVHYYDWCYPWYSPFDLSRPVSYWGLDKPVLVGESPADPAGIYSIPDQIQNSYSNGYAGVMFWSYNSDYSEYWPTTTNELSLFRDAYPELIDYPADRDGDGMPDTWEYLFFGNPMASDGSAVADWDGDGARDLYEYIAGTDPTNNSSVFVINYVGLQGAQPEISWPSVAGREYAVYMSTNLLTGWPELPLTSNITGDGTTKTFTDAMPMPVGGFYRLQVNIVP